VRAKMLVIHTDYTGEIIDGKIEKGYFISKKIVQDVRNVPYILVKFSRFGRPIPVFLTRALFITPYDLKKRVTERMREDGTKERIEFIDITKLPKEQMREIEKAYEAFIDWKGFMKGLGAYKEGGMGFSLDAKKILRIIGGILLGVVGLIIILSIFGVIH